jgi:hypothetical protein
MNKYIHTFSYRKIINGFKPYKPIRMKFWLWGFGVSLETKKYIGGFAINSKKFKPKETLLDSYTQKYPRKIHRKK